MSEQENFLSRWSRLKRESAMEAGSEDKPTADAVPGMDMPTATPFDAAGLPPIESIVADSDIRPFLADGVPAELTRAALRSAWAADPAIRDFIGIAESQWDFNDPAAMPGFGPLGVAEYARALESRVLASLNGAVEGMLESPRKAEPPMSAGADPQCGAPADEVRPIAAAPADEVGLVAAAPADSSSKSATAASPASRARHPQGGALPK
jgi:hypothetical protein